MTAQFREIIIYKGRKQSMTTEPLQYWPGFKNLGMEFISNCTALWRGYLGTWKVVDSKLYLVKLEGQACIKSRTERGEECPEEIREISLSTLFPGQKKVFADWFSGTIRIEQGRLLQYVHMGYDSVYEKELHLEFREGVLVDSQVIKNMVWRSPDED